MAKKRSKQKVASPQKNHEVTEIMSDSEEPVPKKTRYEPADDGGTEDEDLAGILAQIQEQEQNEALALKLQRQWDDGDVEILLDNATQAGSSNINGSSHNGPVASGSSSTFEDDEAMARRLAQEWGTDNETTSKPLPALPRLDGPSDAMTGGFSKTDLAPDDELAGYRDVFTATRDCSKCRKPVPVTRGYVTFSASVPPPSLTRLLHAYCNSCKTNHCRGCFKVVSCNKTCKGTGSGNKECAVTNCCADVRAIALFEVLGGFDRVYVNETTSAASRSVSSVASKGSNIGSVGPGGTGYGTEGYGGYVAMPSPAAVAPKARAPRGKSAASVASLASKWDALVVTVFETLIYFIPNPYAEEPAEYDLLPHASIRSLLSLSYLPEILAGLLRNDSVMDWTARSETYNAMLQLLRRLVDSELTVGLLISPRWSKEKSCGLESWMWKEGDIEWEVPSDDDNTSESRIVRDPPLYEHFKKLTKQCEVFMTGASQLMESDGHGEGEDDTTVKALSLCGDIISTHDDVERAIGVVVASSSNDQQKNGKQKSSPSVTMERLYSQACERLAFKYATFSDNAGPGGIDNPAFYYAQNLKATANSTRVPKDRLHMVKELAVMSTCLPPGIWVRVDEVRNDAIKVMIAGPEKTPYEGGLFEFDCFMPLEYPHKPPLMNLCTTGHGKVRFNPNLYNCGKVCLSLLGTWAGRPEEQWSSKSTFLQVLVSIQSMILVEAPYFNEPGHGKVVIGSAASKSYNRNIMLQTSKWAIVDWLKDTRRDSMWADVIKSHFLIRGEKIHDMLEEWNKIEPKIGRKLIKDFEKGLELIQTWD